MMGAVYVDEWLFVCVFSMIVWKLKRPPKVLGQFVKLKEIIYPYNSSNPTQYNQFSTKNDAGYQII